MFLEFHIGSISGVTEMTSSLTKHVFYLALYPLYSMRVSSWTEQALSFNVQIKGSQLSISDFFLNDSASMCSKEVRAVSRGIVKLFKTTKATRSTTIKKFKITELLLN